jgi:protein TonB
MRFEALSEGESDPGRKKRLAVGYATAIAICTVVGAVGASIKSEIAVAEEEEQVVDVQLAPTAEPPKPQPPLPTPAEPAPRAPAPPGPKHKPIAVPTAVPTEMPAEADPGEAKRSEDDYGEGSGEGVPRGTGAAPAVVPPPPPPPLPRPPPKPAGPIQLSENDTPPEAIATPQPAYPVDVKAEGVEGTVVVRFVVTESGEVTNVTVVKGHPRLDPGVLATVRTWRFKPALSGGRPVSSYKTARFNFRIRT